MFSRDLERVARSMHAQKVEQDYIRHYLVETYAIDNAMVDQIFDRIGMPAQLKPGQKVLPKNKDPMADKRSRQGF
jgi:hypothetical protein